MIGKSSLVAKMFQENQFRYPRALFRFYAML